MLHRNSAIQSASSMLNWGVKVLEKVARRKHPVGHVSQIGLRVLARSETAVC
jgi:hypothetical protein